MSSIATRTHVLKSTNMLDVLTPEPQGNSAAISGVKVVATLGPSCHSEEQLSEMLDAGAAGVRLDLTWGTIEFHRAALRNLQVAMQKTRRLCCTILDVLGREIMVKRMIQMDEEGWPVHEECYTITAGQQVTLTTRPDAVASAQVMPVTYDRFYEMAEAGDTVYVARYLVCGADSASLYLEVQEVKGQDVICIAKNDAVLEGLLTVFHVERSCGHNLSNTQNALHVLSDYDKEAILSLGREFELDFISLSYCKTEDDVHEARAYLSSIGSSSTKILAKIETRQSLLNLEGILHAADGIIISRGNLGLDCPPEKMATIQKTVVQACNLAGKPVIITRVVDTMVDVPRPTRAEATDVANAALDGVDAILLGAETLRGKFPAHAVRTVSSICRSAEKVFDHQHHYDFLMENALEDEEEQAAEAQATGPVEIDAWGGMRGSAPHVPIIGSTAMINTPIMEVTVMEGLLHVSPTTSAGDVHGNGNGVDLVAKVVNPKGTGSIKKSQAHLSTMNSTATLNLPDTGSATALALNRVHKTYGPWRSPYLTKLESIASSAVRVADKVHASLMLVYTHSGASAALVAKYKPPMPILCLVVPNLVSNGLTWQLQGRTYARQSMLVRGLLPVLANPQATGEEGLNDAIEYAAGLGLVKPGNHVVCVQRTHEDTCIKVVSVNHLGLGVKILTKIPKTASPRDVVPAGDSLYRQPSAVPVLAHMLHTPSEALPDGI